MGTQPARGMRDFLPEDVRRRDYVVRVVRDVYDRYGFEPLETPAVENIETLLGRYGDEGNKLIFKILKRGEHEASGQADLALRYDLTVPLARVVAEHQSALPKFFKRYQIQPVWRADRPARGRFREFYQCDIDAIGSTSLTVEAEMCGAASDVLSRLGFNDFTIRLNHRRLLTQMLSLSGLPEDKHTAALVVIDKLDKVGRENVIAELVGVTTSNVNATAMLDMFLLDAVLSNEEKLGRLRRSFENSLVPLDALDELETILTLAGGTAAAGRIRLDPSLARGLSYYTGAIMEITVPDLAGSLGGGGRYDNLIGTFLGRDIPACGFSLGLERMLVVMDERKMFPDSIVNRNAELLVAVWEPSLDWQADALALASSIRAGGIRVDVFPEPEARKVSKQFRYASSRGIPLVALVGPDERAQDMVNVKDLRTGNQTLYKRSNIAGAVNELLRTTEPAGRPNA
jgi:histidyl-tRNA synthetase